MYLPFVLTFVHWGNLKKHLKQVLLQFLNYITIRARYFDFKLRNYFLPTLSCSEEKSHRKEKVPGPVVSIWKPTFIVLAYGLTNALTTILAYIALKMIPLSDIVVFGHTTPIFTLILSAVFLRFWWIEICCEISRFNSEKCVAKYYFNYKKQCLSNVHGYWRRGKQA